MAEVQTAQTASERLPELVDRLEAVEGFAEVVAALKKGVGATLDGVWGSACALASAAIGRHAPATLVIVAPHAGEVEDLIDELVLFTETPGEAFPAYEVSSDEALAVDDLLGQRLRVLKQLAAEQPPKVVVTSIQALVQPVLDRQTLRQQTRCFTCGETLDADALARWLVESGFQHQIAVELPGEFSLRGGIIDLFAPEWSHPVRIELFGDEIESIRYFEAADQRSIMRLDTVELTVTDPQATCEAHLADYLPESSWILLIEPSALDEEGRHFLRRADSSDKLHTVAGVFKRFASFPTLTVESVGAGSFDTKCYVPIESVERLGGDLNQARDELESISGDDRVTVVCQTEAEVKRLAEVFAESPLSEQGRLSLIVGRLRAGFRLVSAGITLLSTIELFRRPDTARLARRRKSRAIDSFLDLREGDLVVHVAHGIARYRGLKLLERGEQLVEHLELEFHGGTKMYVPTSKIHFVQKYIGGGRTHPKLAKLGGRSWLRQKMMAEEAVLDLAHEMLTLQAARATRPGIAFPADSEWQQEFDAAFPYTETADQLDTMVAIKRDMQQSRPMDRLICGDVGYGKTELAMRAAFKAVDAGYQVAVLVPTTVLAEQHYRTFTSRTAEFPFEIGLLSRFLTRSQQTKAIRALAEGKIDIVIGTHRLAQADIRFENLGLVIIDEEQRFGVEVKERLKTLRQTVDVLTLTATPIPRTLHMALLGIRDISNLETPPESRLAVETKVTRFNPELIRHAVLRELSREGQVFFVHNRVHDIEVVARRLKEIVPEASLAIGHGQMNEHELEDVMRGFVTHRFDILLATTIIESGLDIPNANTIFVDQADQYGLADLHQLRGRVGRYKHRAYCYLLLDPAKVLTPVAAKRLRAIEEYSNMGAGFAIAMRDLEIRGAGNILGTSQSGHIAMVGYELYCQLLEKTVRELKSLPPKRTIEVDIDLPAKAYLPRAYVGDIRTKVDLYRRLSWTTEGRELDDLTDELLDRFGPMPPEVGRWLRLGRLRIWAHGWAIHAIRREGKYLVLSYAIATRIEQLRRKSGNRLRIVDDQSAYLPLSEDVVEPDEILSRVESLLQPE